MKKDYWPYLILTNNRVVFKFKSNKHPLYEVVAREVARQSKYKNRKRGK